MGEDSFNRWESYHKVMGTDENKLGATYMKPGKKKRMKIQIDTVCYQLYVTPYVKITTTRILNGNYEIILGWLNKQITINW